jgi:hypothetical protein
MQNVINKIKQEFFCIEVNQYHKDIQNILDRFGAGKFHELNKVLVAKYRDDYIVFILLNTSLGKYLIIDIPSKFSDTEKIFEKVIYQLGLNNLLPAHPVQNSTFLSHSNFSKFGIFKI